MAGYVRGTKRPLLRFVLINARFCYGWKTVDLTSLPGIAQGDVDVLGHYDSTTANAVANRIMVLGANSPKPARVTKKLDNNVTSQRASVSTYIAYNATTAAAGRGWMQTAFQRGVRLVSPGGTKRSVTAVAVLSDGTHYAFPLNQVDFDIAKTPLGLLNATEINSAAERESLATGMKSTRPGKAALEDSGGMLSTYFSTANEDEASTAGWDIISRERIAFPVAPI